MSAHTVYIYAIKTFSCSRIELEITAYTKYIMYIVLCICMLHTDYTHDEWQWTISNFHVFAGVFLHVMADTLGSVGVIISAGLIQMFGKNSCVV
jgi:hypothetical protein